MPSVRSRFVIANERSKCRMSTCPRSVSSWTITSGSKLATAVATCSASSPSARNGVAPCRRSWSNLAGVRVVPATSWPLATSRGTSWRPMAPVAPATKIFIVSVLHADVLGVLRGRRDRVLQP